MGKEANSTLDGERDRRPETHAGGDPHQGIVRDHEGSAVTANNGVWEGALLSNVCEGGALTGNGRQKSQSEESFHHHA